MRVELPCDVTDAQGRWCELSHGHAQPHSFQAAERPPEPTDDMIRNALDAMYPSHVQDEMRSDELAKGGRLWNWMRRVLRAAKEQPADTEYQRGLEDGKAGLLAERLPAKTDADAIAQTTTFLRERGIDDPERAATDLVKNLRVYGVAERRDPPLGERWAEPIRAALDAGQMPSLDDVRKLLTAWDVLLADARGEMRDAQEPPDWAYQANTISVNLMTAWDCRDWRGVEVAATQLAAFRDRLRAGGPAREEPSELLVAMTGMLAMFGGHDALDHDTDAAAKKCDKCRVLADARNAYGDAALSSGLPAPEEGS